MNFAVGMSRRLNFLLLSSAIIMVTSGSGKGNVRPCLCNSITPGPKGLKLWMSTKGLCTWHYKDCSKPLYEEIAGKCMAIAGPGIPVMREQHCEKGLKGEISNLPDEEMVREMSKWAKNKVKDAKLLKKEYWIGIEKSVGFGSSGKWKYTKNNEELNDYELWAEDPKGGDCAAVRLDKDFKVVARNCDQKKPFVCMSDSKDCGADQFMNSFGFCIYVNNFDEKKFPKANDDCRFKDSSLIPLRDETMRKAIIPAIHTAPFSNGLCVDVKKSDGKWTDRKGNSPPDDMWDDSIPRNWDYLVFKLMEDWTMKLYTVKYSNSLMCMCEKKGVRLDQRSCARLDSDVNLPLWD